MKLIKGEIEKTNDKPFDYEQMNIHLYDIIEEIDLKVSKRKIKVHYDLVINYRNTTIPVNITMIKFAYIYKKLKKTYRLDAKILLEKILTDNEINHITEFELTDLLKEIRKQNKIQAEKEVLKKKIVWKKKDH